MPIYRAVLAFNITVGDPPQNLTITEILDIPAAQVQCNATCSVASSNIANCNDDATCLCSSATADSIVNCENCMLHFLIAQNERMPDFRAGSNPVVAAYAASCQADNITLRANQSALTLPDNWDGPFVAVLPVGGTAVTVIAGAFLGFSALMILSNMDDPSSNHVPPALDSPDSQKFRSQARQLQELFPSWTNDDLLSLLNDVGGDVQIAATRITEGTVEIWGEVSRKKDKKAPATSKTPAPTRGVPGDTRGTRGGRGGRGGGPGRGGAVTRGRGGLPRGGANGHIPRTDNPRPSSAAPAVNGHAADSTKAPATDDSTAKHESPDHQQQQNGASGWVETSLTESPAQPTSTWGAKDVPSTAQASHAAAVKQASKPATSKLSWAQIARPQEKPAPLSAPTPSQLPPQPAVALPPPSAPEPEAPTESQEHGWEEPTTVEAPTWDEEPQKQPAATEAWPPSAEPPTEFVKAVETPPAPAAQEVSKPEPVEEPTAVPEPVPEPKVEVKAASPAPVAAQATLASQAAATPSPKLSARPAVVSHRSSARHKVTDQPVTMPISFGTGIEKVGMQFGSLSLAGDGSVTVQPESEASPAVSEPATPPAPQAKAQPEQVPPPPPATAPASSTSLTSVFQQQQAQPPQQPAQPQALPTQAATPHHTIPTSISQPIPPSQTSAPHGTAASPLQTYAQQQNNAQQLNNSHLQQQPQHLQQPPNLHQQPQHLQHLPQQLQQNHSTHHSYTQHGLPTHIDPSQSAQGPVQQPLPNATHSNYFRQAEAASSVPYFHTPTPPAAQSQESTYGSFGQLGAQAQHQQPSHLGAFASSDYGYAENSRAFYDSYAQQSSFGGRNPLVHDDGKGIPGSQQPTNANLPPSSGQGPQHASQAANQPQPAGGQGPQQNYPPPLPYYYTHAYPQNQYYGSPYSSGYVPQPFVKYPTMFQPGPPGPGSAANPAAKQPAGNVGVQPQTNPYNQGLYQQAGYDDYQPHPHHSQHQHQHTHSLGLSQGAVGVGAGEYGKQLYGAGGQGGMQGFMGLGGQSATGGAGPASNAGPRSAASPEAAYKPYASKDVSSSASRGAPVQQGGQGQGQPQNQSQGPTGQGGPQGQSFYGGNRFGSGVGGAGSGGVGGAPQQAGHHQQAGPHLGYPQGGNEPNFYGYQPRQQQGYWQ
ncbi:hypothetical protein CPB84DRAFT_1816015 [Gymnopilus junonius]|uniref:RNA polymerase II degradation factor 1 n=1 Tax=Gymnopilus junonius TaxID=109634 RepID=A0A9P5NIC7_GYMJU|nr:hypothetical protein CPB84DRAFT_1816015 [Gymnopilus junonius]